MHLLPLGRDEFAEKLNSGHGRAVLHVQRHGLDCNADIFLDACLHNRSYDPQCEDGRSEWLFSIIKNQQEISVLRESLCTVLPLILSQVDHGEINDVEYSISQCFELAGFFARSGDVELAGAVRSVGKCQYFNWDFLAAYGEWIKLDGLPALLNVVRLAGRWLRENPEETWRGWPFLNMLLEECQLESVGREALENASKIDLDVAEFLDFNRIDSDAAGGDGYVDRYCQEWPVEKIIDDAYQHAGDALANYRRFGRAASKKDLLQIWQVLIECQDELACRRLLWVFRGVSMPDFHERILSWLDSDDVDLKIAAIDALSGIQHSRIAEEARRRLLAAPGDHLLLPLMIRNGSLLDDQFASHVLNNLPVGDRDVLHKIGMSFLKISDHDDRSHVKAILDWIYENTPCSICRESAVRRMKELGWLSSQQVIECQFDADEGVRDLIVGEYKSREEGAV